MVSERRRAYASMPSALQRQTHTANQRLPRMCSATLCTHLCAAHKCCRRCTPGTPPACWRVCAPPRSRRTPRPCCRAQSLRGRMLWWCGSSPCNLRESGAGQGLCLTVAAWQPAYRTRCKHQQPGTCRTACCRPPAEPAMPLTIGDLPAHVVGGAGGAGAVVAIRAQLTCVIRILPNFGGVLARVAAGA